MKTVRFQRKPVLIVAILGLFTVLWLAFSAANDVPGRLQATSNEFRLHGKPFRVLSGAMHYFRIVPEYWRDRLLKLKAMGLNTVETWVGTILLHADGIQTKLTVPPLLLWWTMALYCKVNHTTHCLARVKLYWNELSCVLEHAPLLSATLLEWLVEYIKNVSIFWEKLMVSPHFRIRNPEYPVSEQLRRTILL